MPISKWTPHRKRALVCVMILPFILTGCETLTRIRAPSITTAQGDARPVACDEFQVIHFSTGKPGVTADNIAAELKRENPVGHVRNVVGDTSQTIAQIKESNAAYHALCDSK